LLLHFNCFYVCSRLNIVHFLLSAAFPLPLDLLAVDWQCDDASNDPAPVDKFVVAVLASAFAEPDHLRDAEVEETAEEDDGACNCSLVLSGEERVAVGEGEGLGGVAAHVLEHEADLVQPLTFLVHREMTQHAEDHDVDLADREAELLQHPAEQEHVQRRDGLYH
jgi:hypothetical protein